MVFHLVSSRWLVDAARPQVFQSQTAAVYSTAICSTEDLTYSIFVSINATHCKGNFPLTASYLFVSSLSYLSILSPLFILFYFLFRLAFGPFGYV